MPYIRGGHAKSGPKARGHGWRQKTAMRVRPTRARCWRIPTKLLCRLRPCAPASKSRLVEVDAMPFEPQLLQSDQRREGPIEETGGDAEHQALGGQADKRPEAESLLVRVDGPTSPPARQPARGARDVLDPVARRRHHLDERVAGQDRAPEGDDCGRHVDLDDPRERVLVDGLAKPTGMTAILRGEVQQQRRPAAQQAPEAEVQSPVDLQELCAQAHRPDLAAALETISTARPTPPTQRHEIGKLRQACVETGRLRELAVQRAAGGHPGAPVCRGVLLYRSETEAR
mmetsp:Transcript_43333/g.130958  ORF Transcript_43333/g.130958 Transcript_43333/m.130958 type:complete len:286 (-) Transcript_43333:1183-2040(-)